MLVVTDLVNIEIDFDFNFSETLAWFSAFVRTIYNNHSGHNRFRLKT